jgi:hypothetical protein
MGILFSLALAHCELEMHQISVCMNSARNLLCCNVIHMDVFPEF